MALKLRRLIVITALIVVAIAAMIFFFSSQTGPDSSRASQGIAEFLMRLFHPDFDQLQRGEQAALRSRFQEIARKGAHFTEFALLGLSLRLLLEWLRPRWKKSISWAAGTLYAVTDEIHQRFVDSRSAQLTDVGIDSLGVLTGVLIMTGILLLIRKRKRKRAKPGEDKA